MSIASAITAAQGRVADCYTAISNKGGTLPVTQNLKNMPTAIGSIPSGGSATIDSLTITPTTSQQTITASGGVDGYSPITVNAVTASIDNNITAGNIKKNVQILGVTGSYEGGGGGYTEIPSYQISNNTISRRSKTLTGTEFSGITSVGSYGLYFCFYGCTNVTGPVDLSSLTTIADYGLYDAFSGSGVTGSLNLSSLTTVNTYGFSYTFQYCTGLTGLVNLSSLTTVGDDGFYYAFRGCTGLTSINLESLSTVSGEYAFYHTFNGCTGLTSIDLSSLTTVSGTRAFQEAFGGCTRLTTLDLSSLTTISATYAFRNTFYGCTSLTSVDLSSLTSVSSNGLYSTFSNCTRLTSVTLPALTTVTGSDAFYDTFYNCTGLTKVYFSSLSSILGRGFYYAFRGCTGLTDVYFNSLTTSGFGTYNTQFRDMLYSTGSTTTHTLHFPSNLETTIQGLTGYPTFGGNSGYVVLSFDLPATS